MTLAIFDGVSLVADRSVYKDGFITNFTNKIRPINTDNVNGYFVGSGNITDIDIVYESLINDAITLNKLAEDEVHTSCQILSIDPSEIRDYIDCMLIISLNATSDYKVYQIDNSGRALPVYAPYAIGHRDAQLAARAAIAAGADALTALKIACDLTMISYISKGNFTTYDKITI